MYILEVPCDISVLLYMSWHAETWTAEDDQVAIVINVTMILKYIYYNSVFMPDFRFLANSRLFYSFLTIFVNCPESLRTFWTKKWGGKLAQLLRCFFLRRIRFTLKFTFGTYSEKSQVNKCCNSDTRVCIISWISYNLDSWIGSIIPSLLRCALCFTE